MKGLGEGASLLPLGFTVPPLPVLSRLRPSTRPGCERGHPSAKVASRRPHLRSYICVGRLSLITSLCLSLPSVNLPLHKPG